MKRLIIISGIITAVYILMVTVVMPQAQAPSTTAVAAQTAVQEGFTVGESDGRVAVYRDGELYLRTEMMLSSLPKSDRVRLEEGIHVDSLKELKALLQDYCS